MQIPANLPKNKNRASFPSPTQNALFIKNSNLLETKDLKNSVTSDCSRKSPPDQLGLFSATQELPETLPLRDYQEEVVTQILSEWDLFLRVCAQLPTGSGKSLIIVQMVLEFVRRGEPVLLIAHKIELIRQLKEHCERWLPSVELGIIADKSQYKRNPNALIQIGSIQAFNYLKDYPPASLIIFDECHHCHAKSYAKLFKYYENSYVLGVTATPMRIDGRGLRFLYEGIRGFESLIKGVSVRELIERGFLCDFKFFAASDLVDPQSAGVHTRMGDYVQSEVEELVDQVLLYGDVIETWEKHARNKKTVIYPVSVKYSKELCQAFRDAGWAAEHLDADTPASERVAIMNRFKSGETIILCQHSIVIEGVDVPDIEAVVFARPTKSLTIWFQAIGRALRPAENKPFAIIIDHTTTHQNLPFPDEPMEWGLDAVSLPEGTKHSLTCPNCNHIFRAISDDLRRLWSQCPNCQSKISFAIGKGKGRGLKAVKILPADFEELPIHQCNESVMTAIDELIKYQQAHGYKPSWVYYELKRQAIEEDLPVGLFELKELASRLGYKEGWGFYKYQEIQQELALMAHLTNAIDSFNEF